MPPESLHIADDLELPLQAVTWTFSILAMRGAGKSNTAVVMAEEMHKAELHWIAIDPKGDWWGVQSSGDGKKPGLSVPVFGGEHGNIPLYPESGAALADYLVGEGISAVIDLSEFTKTEMNHFLGGPDFGERGKQDGFFARLYKRKNRNQPPTHVFLEEVDEYLPQQVTSSIAKLHYDGQKVSTKGRFRGLGATCATQRPARFHNDVLTQTDILIAMRNMAPPEIKQAELWVKFHGQSKEIVQSLPSLEDGEGWFVAPNKMKVVKRTRFRRRETLDTGATPEVIVRGKRRPPTLAEIDIPALETSLQETIERAKAEDPNELRKQIIQLERKIAELEEHECPESEPVEPVIKELPVPVIEEGDIVRITTGVQEMRKIVSDVQEVGDAMLIAFEKLAKTGDPVALPVPVDVTASPSDSTSIRESSSSKAVTRNEEQGEPGELLKGEKKVLGVLVQFRDGRRINQLALQSGYRVSGGFRNILAALRAKGYIVGGNKESMKITEAGVKALGDDWEPLPTGPALLDYWCSVHLNKGEERTLRVFVAAGKDGLTIDEVASRAGYEVSGGFRNILSRLRTLELIEGRNVGVMKATNDILEQVA